MVGATGGTLATLSFAIVGDCTPPNINNTAGYPTAVITKIWQDIQAASPRPAFAITTGNYMFASPTGNQVDSQLALYQTARASFSNVVFPAMGNHECTGALSSNCGLGNADGMTPNYNAFIATMLGPIGKKRPYYVINVNGNNNAWTAKFVFVAGNAWDSTQAKWLESVLTKQTTYTFIVRNAPVGATTCPGTSTSNAIIAKHPYTLLIAGLQHTYAYSATNKQVIVGNGGAPLSGSVNYGYVIARQQPNGSMKFTEYDYATNAAQASFTVGP